MSDTRSQDLAYSRYHLTLDSTSAAYHLAPEPDYVMANASHVSVPRGTVDAKLRDTALAGTEKLEWVFRPQDHVTIPPKYKNCLVFLRSFYLLNNEIHAHCRPQFVRVQLMNANMPNNYHALDGKMVTDRQQEGGQRITRGQTLGIVPLRRDDTTERQTFSIFAGALANPAGYAQTGYSYDFFAMKGHEFPGDVASRGKLLGGTLLNDEITIRLDVPTHTTEHKANAVPPNNNQNQVESSNVSLARHFIKYDGVAVPGGTGGAGPAINTPVGKWVMELEIQMLENRHD